MDVKANFILLNDDHTWDTYEITIPFDGPDRPSEEQVVSAITDSLEAPGRVILTDMETTEKPYRLFIQRGKKLEQPENGIFAFDNEHEAYLAAKIYSSVLRSGLILVSLQDQDNWWDLAAFRDGVEVPIA